MSTTTIIHPSDKIASDIFIAMKSTSDNLADFLVLKSTEITTKGESKMAEMIPMLDSYYKERNILYREFIIAKRGYYYFAYSNETDLACDDMSHYNAQQFLKKGPFTRDEWEKHRFNRMEQGCWCCVSRRLKDTKALIDELIEDCEYINNLRFYETGETFYDDIK